MELENEVKILRQKEKEMDMKVKNGLEKIEMMDLLVEELNLKNDFAT